jgi:ketosteroid isomerase-like protein
MKAKDENRNPKVDAMLRRANEWKAEFKKATGRTFKARFAHVWTIRDGIIVRLQQSADTVQIAHALEP